MRIGGLTTQLLLSKPLLRLSASPPGRWSVEISLEGVKAVELSDVEFLRASSTVSFEAEGEGPGLTISPLSPAVLLRASESVVLRSFIFAPGTRCVAVPRAEGAEISSGGGTIYPERGKWLLLWHEPMTTEKKRASQDAPPLIIPGSPLEEILAGGESVELRFECKARSALLQLSVVSYWKPIKEWKRGLPSEALEVCRRWVKCRASVDEFEGVYQRWLGRLTPWVGLTPELARFLKHYWYRETFAYAGKVTTLMLDWHLWMSR